MTYAIYVVEQSGTIQEPFNRAKLINAGVIEGILHQQFDNTQKVDGLPKFCCCVILHDVDMLPVRTLKNFYINLLNQIKNF